MVVTTARLRRRVRDLCAARVGDRSIRRSATTQPSPWRSRKHHLYEHSLDRIVAEELQPAIAGERQEMNVRVPIVSTKFSLHPPNLSDIVSVPHPLPPAKDGGRTPNKDTLTGIVQVEGADAVAK